LRIKTTGDRDPACVTDEDGKLLIAVGFWNGGTDCGTMGISLSVMVSIVRRSKIVSTMIGFLFKDFKRKKRDFEEIFFVSVDTGFLTRGAVTTGSFQTPT